MNFIGYNVFQYTSAFIQHIERLQPSSLLFCNDDGGAMDAARRLPGCRVIARAVNDKYEKEMHLTKGEVRKHLEHRAREVDAGRVYVNLGCEPPNDRLDLLVEEYIAALDWAEPRGIKVAAPHLAHYGIDDFTPLIPLAERIAQRPDLWLLTADEYFAAVPFSGVVDPRLPGGSEAGHADPATWKRSPVGVYYHCGRIGRLFDLMRAQGKPLPLTVITEGGADALQDVEAWRESLLHTPPYDAIRGWRSCARQWEEWGAARGWSAQRYFAEGLRALRDEVYSQWENVVGYLLYIEGNNGDPAWLGFNTADDDLRREIEAIPPKGTTMPEAPANWQLRAVLPAGGAVNVRLQPTLAASVFRKIEPPGVVAWLDVLDVPPSGDPKTIWHRLRFSDHQTGYVRADVVRIAELGGTQAPTLDVARVIDELETAAGAIANATARLTDTL